MKPTLIAISILIGIAGILYLSVNGITRYMVNTKDCDFLNIDIIEMNTDVGLPAMTNNCKCDYNETTNVKIFDTSKTSVSGFIRRNNFTLVNNSNKIIFDKFLNFETDNNAISNSDLYFIEKNNDRSVSQMLVNIKTSQLWVIVNYKH